MHGYLWFGTQDGLNRYDGSDFTIYLPQTSAGNARVLSAQSGTTHGIVNALHEDRDNNLWIGTSSGLNRFQPETNTFVHYRYLPDDPASLSHQTVSAIADDTQGKLWVGTERGGLNLLDRDTGKFTHFRHDPTDPRSISSDRISSIVEIDGMLWIGTQDAGINYFDPASGVFTHFRHDPDDTKSLSSDLVTYLLLGSNSYLWIATRDGGLNRYSIETEVFERYQHDVATTGSISSNAVRTLYEDSADRLWVGHFNTDGGGLDLFQHETGIFIQNTHQPGVPHSLSDDHISAIYEDRGGVIWVGTFVGGLNKYNGKRKRFRHFQRDLNNPDSLSNNIIRSFYKHGRHLYVGTEGGLNVLDNNTGLFTHYLHDPAKADSIAHNIVRGLDMDDQGYLWLATHGGLSRFDPQNKTFTNFRHNPNDPYSIGSDTVWRVHVDNQGMVWAGTRDQLNRLDVQTGRFERFEHHPTDPQSIGGDRIIAIYEDNRADMWFSTLASGVNRFSRNTGRFINLNHLPENSNSLSDTYVFSIAEDVNGVFWFGTRGGLSRFDPVTETYTRFTTADGLPNNVIYGILIDDANNLWLSTNRGLSRFTPASLTFTNFGPHDGLQDEEFNNGAYYLADDGEMYFGGINGFNAFTPETIDQSNYSPPVVVTRFEVLNEERMIGVSFAGSQQIELHHAENYLSFEFAALDFSAPEKNLYRYKLEGFDDQWIEAGNRRYASYTNLNPGSYLFVVQGTNSDGIWSQNLARVPLYIVPAYWQTTWFQVFIMISVALLLLMLHRYKTISVNRRNAVLEVLVSERTAMLESSNTHLQAEVLQRQKAEEEIRKIAYHDHLTGLPNRRLFMSFCKQAIAVADRDKEAFAILFLDLDLFKQINDQWGHDAGDSILVAVAQRIRNVVRASDIMCRLGGDEFVLLLANVRDREFVASIANKLINTISQPVTIQPANAGVDQKINVGVSIGISLYPEDDVTLDTLLSKADHAMYEAKKAGCPSYHFHNGAQ